MTKRRPGSRTDTERLDFWQANPRLIFLVGGSGNYMWGAHAGVKGKARYSASVRYAIDAAIKASQRTRKRTK